MHAVNSVTYIHGMYGTQREVIRYDEITVGQTCTHILHIPCSINEPTAKGCTAMLAGYVSMALHAFHHAFVFTYTTIAHTYRTTIYIHFIFASQDNYHCIGPLHVMSNSCVLVPALGKQTMHRCAPQAAIQTCRTNVYAPVLAFGAS